MRYEYSELSRGRKAKVEKVESGTFHSFHFVYSFHTSSCDLREFVPGGRRCATDSWILKASKFDEGKSTGESATNLLEFSSGRIRPDSLLLNVTRQKHDDAGGDDRGDNAGDDRPGDRDGSQYRSRWMSHGLASAVSE
jgi:hypothetical protein